MKEAVVKSTHIAGSDTFSSFSLAKLWVLSPQSCPTLCDPVDCSPPGSSVHVILQARTLEWAAMPSSRGSSHVSWVSRIAGRFFTQWATWKAPGASNHSNFVAQEKKLQNLHQVVTNKATVNRNLECKYQTPYFPRICLRSFQNLPLCS